MTSHEYLAPVNHRANGCAMAGDFKGSSGQVSNLAQDFGVAFVMAIWIVEIVAISGSCTKGTVTLWNEPAAGVHNMRDIRDFGD